MSRRIGGEPEESVTGFRYVPPVKRRERRCLAFVIFMVIVAAVLVCLV